MQGRVGPTQLFLLLLRTLPDRLLVVIDDCPTMRYGPKVKGADVHRDPTPVPADQEYLYCLITISTARLLLLGRFGDLAHSGGNGGHGRKGGSVPCLWTSVRRTLR